MNRVVCQEVSSSSEQSGEKRSSSSGRMTAGSTGDMVLEKNEQASSACLRDNDKQSTFSSKLGKQIIGSSGKSADGQKKPVVTLDENFDGQLGKKSSTEKKEDADDHAVLHHGSAVMKGYKKSDGLTSRPGMEQSHSHNRRSSDGNGSRHHDQNGRHLRDKPDAEQTLRNGEQLVPPLKIRLEHHSKTADQQTAAAGHSLNTCGSDDVDAAGKTSDAKHTGSASTTHAADSKTEKKDVMPADRDAGATKDDTHNTAADQRRTRNTSTTRPMPVITKRRLTFEESLIAGTCISTTSSSAIATDSAKTSAAAPSTVCSETVHSVGVGPHPTTKLTAATKATSVLNIPVKKDANSSKKLKLEDEKSLPYPHLSTTKMVSDEVTVKMMSSHSLTEDSNHVKSLSQTIPVHEESESNLIESKSVAEIKCDNKRDPISSDSKSVYMKSYDAGPKNEVSMKNSLAEEPQSQLAKHSSSDRTISHRHHHHDHHRHSSSSTKPHRMAGTQLDYELRQSRHGSSKYGSLMHVETHPNGGASVVHAFEDELAGLSPRELSEFVREFFRVVFDEEPAGVPHHVMGIVHNSAAYLPDILEYFASAHPDMIVKRNLLGKSSDVETTTISEYFQLVQSTYLAGTYRTGPLDHFSIVGTKAEETGGYFPEFLDLLDQNEFLKYVSPWGKISELENMPRNESNDGPIVWARPGEQVVPTADMPKSPMVKKR